VSFNCNFIRSAMLGDSVVARAQVSRCTNSLAFVASSVHLARDPTEPIVTGNGIYFLPQKTTTAFNIQTAMRQAYEQAAVKVIAASTPPEDAP
jgi:acyl-CoA thioesterase FadM